MNRGRPLLAALLVAAPVLVFMSPASATTATDGPCPVGVGVTVVVNFQRLGGGTVVRCAAGAQNSGFDALRNAGFTYNGTSTQPGFLCRIDGKPSASADPCINPSPVDSYWSYWHTPAGGAWVYGTKGAADTRPAVGTVEGWSFGVDEETYDPLRPSSRAPDAAAPPVTSAPTSRAPATGPPTTRLPSPSPSAPPTTVPATVLGATLTAPPASTTSVVAADPQTAATTVDVTETTAPAPAEVELAGASKARRSGEKPSTTGTPLGTIVGLALIMGVVGAIGLGGWRAGRTAPDD